MFETFYQLEGSNHAQPRTTALLSIKDNLMPLSWHMPVSKAPFRYAVAIRQSNYSYALLQKHQSFTLNFLPIEYAQIVDNLGRVHGDSVNKLQESGLELYARDAKGNALLSDSEFIYECQLFAHYSDGDHTLFIADVQKIHINQTQTHKPMLFMGKGRYTTIGEVKQMLH